MILTRCSPGLSVLMQPADASRPTSLELRQARSRGPGRRTPVIPRSVSFCDARVAQRHGKAPALRRRGAGAEALELESMNPCYLDIDGFWLRHADNKSPEMVPITNEEYGRHEIGGEPGLNSNSSFKPADVLL